ncbi:MAG TPA: class I SAM-dependent methyltransferase [Thermomicrobiales bacterium]|nr:class I SAM-dependent methyltransferase [Thermomicrobiales bacterium]
MDTPRSDWYLDELAHAGPEHLDAAYVATYDRKAQTDFSADLALLRERGLDEGSTLVDLGAGTGGLALAAAPHCRRVVAVDVSPAMLAALRARADDLGLANVECVRAGLLTYEHQGPPADVVYTRNALHHLPDFWKALALARVAAVLRPGGGLRLRDLVFSFDPHEAGAVIEPWLAGAPARPEDGYTRPELATHIREEYSTFSWLLEPMLARAGFAIEETEYSPGRVFAAYTCVKR